MISYERKLRRTLYGSNGAIARRQNFPTRHPKTFIIVENVSNTSHTDTFYECLTIRHHSDWTGLRLVYNAIRFNKRRPFVWLLYHFYFVIINFVFFFYEKWKTLRQRFSSIKIISTIFQNSQNVFGIYKKQNGTSFDLEKPLS